MMDRPAKPADSRWTDEQWQAITERGNNVLVAAAAGSGKTAVLVARILRIISDEQKPVDVDRLLVATFTKAAADEMKQRMRQALEEKLSEGAESPHLRRQLALIHRASFTTLHAFCMDVVTRHYARIPLDPGFRVANETEAELLRQDALEDFFETVYGECQEDSPFWGLLERYGGQRGDDGLHELVLRLHDFSRSHPFPDEWLRDAARQFADFRADPSNPLIRHLLAEAAFALDQARAELQAALAVCREPGGPDVYIDTIGGELAALEQLLAAAQAGAWDELAKGFSPDLFGRLKAARGDHLDKQLAERAKAWRDKAKQRMQELGKLLFSRPLAEFADEMRQAAPYMAELADLVIRFGDRYGEMKKAKRLLDFADLEHFALRVLCAGKDADGRLLPTEAALEYREHYEEILIDEFQDTNEVQEAILSLIARPAPGNRFMVGDVKQSIYRFRLAEPGIFLAKYGAYRSGESAGGENGTAIDLSRNFRSRRIVVDTVNFLFRQIMTERAAEIEYTAEAELVCGLDDPEPPDSASLDTELVLIHRDGGEEGHDDARAANAEETEGGLDEIHESETAELEARFVAGRIRELVGLAGKPALRVWDRALGAHRDATYRDFAILLRATSAWAPVFVEQLAHAGIPAYAELSSGYFDAIEVDMMLSLLQVIDNPLQDIPLAGVLRSPIVGLRAEQLARIRLAHPTGTYYEAMLAFLEGAAGSRPTDDTSEEAAEKLAVFLGRLRSWRGEAERGGLSDLIWRIYRETGFYDYMGGLPGGTQRQANLKALYDRARQFEATSLRGLFRFLRFIRRMQESGNDLGAAKTMGEQDNVVRVMSIHKSKGLEFPVVIVAGLAKMFNERDLQGDFLLHRSLGFGPLIVDPETRVSYPSLAHQAIARKLRMEMVAEEMRILYVALTRAKEKLILLGTTRNVENLVQRWHQAAMGAGPKLSAGAIADARSFLDWIGPALLRHPDLAEFREAWKLPAPPGFERKDAARFALRVVPQGRLAGWREAAAGSGGDRAWLARAAAGEVLPAPPGQLVLPDSAAEEKARIPDEVAEWLGWTYPYGEASRLHAKTSVTEVKRLREAASREDEAWPAGQWLPRLPEETDAAVPSESAGGPRRRGGAFSRRPQFLEEKRMSAAERGTAYHAVMQHIPLVPPVDEARVMETIRHMTERDMLLPAQAREIDPRIITGFFGSDFGRRLLGAGHVEREVPFSYILPARDVHLPGGEGLDKETVLIQGVVDCLFEEEDGLVLVDFKTDRVIGDPYRLAASYRVQLDLYARAVQAVRKKTVKQKALYFFDGGHLVTL